MHFSGETDSLEEIFVLLHNQKCRIIVLTELNCILSIQVLVLLMGLFSTISEKRKYRIF